MKFKNFQIGKKQENPENGTDDAGDAMVNQIANMEEHVNGKTKALEETEQQLKELSGAVAPEEETQPRPHGPLGELTVEPDDIGDEEIDTNALFEGDDEEAPVVEVIKEETPVVEVIKAETPADATGESAADPAEATPVVKADDSLSSLFGDEEEEANPLAALIDAMPDVTPQELIDDLQEIHQIIKDWQH